MKRGPLLAGAADRATMVDGCPLGKVAEQTSRAIFGTQSDKTSALVRMYSPQSLGKTSASTGVDVQRDRLVAVNYKHWDA